MAAVTGEMSIDQTAAASLAAARATGMMIARINTGSGHMSISEPADVSGLMTIQTHASDGLMLINISS